MFTGRKLPLTLAFVVLVALAFGASCKGFFVDPALTSIAINPTAPQVDAGKTLQLQAFGNYDDGTRKQIKSGVSWSSKPTTVATIDANTGLLQGVTSGQATITASAEALSGTAAATVLLTNVTEIKVDPTSGGFHAGGVGQDFNFTATANGVTDIPLTTDSGGILTITPTATNPPICTVVGESEECTGDLNVTPGTYSVRMSYPGSTASVTATLTVSNP
jgi:hypothetical protein